MSVRKNKRRLSRTIEEYGRGRWSPVQLIPFFPSDRHPLRSRRLFHHRLLKSSSPPYRPSSFTLPLLHPILIFPQVTFFLLSKWHSHRRTLILERPGVTSRPFLAGSWRWTCSRPTVANGSRSTNSGIMTGLIAAPVSVPARYSGYALRFFALMRQACRATATRRAA